MAAAKRTTKRSTDTGPLSMFYRALRTAGCVYCPRCRAFMYPDHTEHIVAGALDARGSRYVIVGGYGHVRLVDLHADDMPVAA